MITQKMESASSPVQSDLTASKTRSGRVSKPPERYVPVEQVEDDYASEDYDSNDPDDDGSGIETGSDEEDDESDADEYGNLDGFVVPDKSESDDDSTDGESSVSTKRGTPPVPVPVRVSRAGETPRRSVRRAL
jgi:hypothetical protein